MDYGDDQFVEVLALHEKFQGLLIMRGGMGLELSMLELQAVKNLFSSWKDIEYLKITNIQGNERLITRKEWDKVERFIPEN